MNIRVKGIVHKVSKTSTTVYIAGIVLCSLFFKISIHLSNETQRLTALEVQNTQSQYNKTIWMFCLVPWYHQRCAVNHQVCCQSSTGDINNSVHITERQPPNLSRCVNRLCFQAPLPLEWITLPEFFQIKFDLQRFVYNLALDLFHGNKRLGAEENI